MSENLALACFHCNRFKGPNIAGIDPESETLVRLFHPRTDSWKEHFRFEEALIIGRTPIARATIEVLAMNAQDSLLFRMELLEEGESLA